MHTASVEAKKKEKKGKGKTKKKTPFTSEVGYKQQPDPNAGAFEYQAKAYFTTMFNLDKMDDEVLDTAACPSVIGLVTMQMQLTQWAMQRNLE
eukprot:2442142-Amphidinium_carterae.1